MKTIILCLVSFFAAVHVTAASESDSGYAAHEWGTFTSVQGADGIQLEWNPLNPKELPRFVYDRSRPGGDGRKTRIAFSSSKTAFRTLQRMETPVIYFYSDQPQTVDVTVDFPQGLITEWYPRVTEFGPYFTTNRAETALSQKSFVRWTGVEVLPRRQNARLAEALPSDASGSHYFAARGADSEILRIRDRQSGTAEHEKFLFYRGVGNFSAPLEVTLSGADHEFVNLRNTSSNLLSHMILLAVHEGKGKFTSLERLAGGQNEAIKFQPEKNLSPLPELIGQLSEKIRVDLEAEGLDKAEAEAMVQTWRSSWLEEEGLRVLYTLPSAWTDRVLPLRLQPPPRNLVRVMVGRAEVITPQIEWELLKQIVRYSESDESGRQQVIHNVPRLGLGRFAEPATRRVLGNHPSRQFSLAAWELLQATGKPVAEKRGLALR